MIMKNINSNIKYLIALLVVSMTLLTACTEEENPAISNDLRVISITYNATALEEGSEVETENPQIEMVFSHSLNTTALEEALSISNVTDYVFSYDETNSFVTIAFSSPLDYETSYTLSLPGGSYGASGEALVDDYALTFSTKAFVPSQVTLSVDKTGLLEGESASISATINQPTTVDVTVSLSFAGNAIHGMDYSLSAESLSIPKGSTSSTVTLTAINDSDIEGEESVQVTIGELINAVESGTQQINLTINDELPALIIKGVMALRWATETDGNSGKAVHLKAVEDIADLSLYSLGVANNGGGTDSIEFNLPTMSVLAGEDILIAREPSALESYFETTCYGEFEHIIQTDEMSQNGDDAIELFKGTAVIETYGDADVDGTDQSWEYAGSWAYKLGGNWTTGLVNCSEGSSSTLESDCIYPLCDNPLILKGVLAISWDGSGTNGGKAVHLLANRDIADLGVYSVGVANNGGGTDGLEYSLTSMSVSEGDHILLAREVNTLSTYFGTCFSGFNHVFETDAMNQNGDDAIELFEGSTIIEVFGDSDVDGTGQPWEYAGSWAYKVGSKWTHGGVDCAATSTTTQNSACPYTFCD